MNYQPSNDGRFSTTPPARNAKKLARRTLRFALIAADCVMLTLAFALAIYIRAGAVNFEALTTIAGVTLGLYLFTALNSRAYDLAAVTEWTVGVRRALTSVAVAVLAVALILFFLKAGEQFSRVVLASGAAAAVGLIALGRFLIAKIGQLLLGASPFMKLVIRDGVDWKFDDDVQVLDAAATGLSPDASDPLCVQRLGTYVGNVDHVIIACPPERRAAWSFLLKALDVNAEIHMPELDLLGAVRLNQLQGMPTVVVSVGPLELRQRVLKRLFDLAVVAAALPLLAIPMLVTALLIRLEDKGPVLFRQMRIGLGNRPFEILKFRSMKVERTDALGAQSASREDDRVTRVGRFIRRTSIDELPQIFNVLRGNMSIVGPRPHAVGSTAENLLFWDIDDRYWHRHAVKPGLTGLAQVRGYRGATEARADLSNRLQSDLEYRANWSLTRDMSILLATARVLFHRNAF